MVKQPTPTYTKSNRKELKKMKIKGLKHCSGMTENFCNNGLINQIYYNRKTGLVFCRHETENTYTLFTDGSVYIMKSKNHITMQQIKNAIEERISRI